MQQVTAIPLSVRVPPLSDVNFEQVLNAMTMVEQQQQMQQQHPIDSATALSGLPAENTLSSPIPLLVSEQHHQSSQISFTSSLSMGEDDVKINNPLVRWGYRMSIIA
jgi:hypothetical protein